jgi:hypothetical protein
MLKYSINQTQVILMALLLLYLSYFPASYGPGLTSIAQILVAMMLALIGVVNYSLTESLFCLKKTVLIAFCVSSFLLITPFIIDNILPKLSDVTFSIISLVGVFLSGLIYLVLLFFIWRNYFQNK